VLGGLVEVGGLGLRVVGAGGKQIEVIEPGENENPIATAPAAARMISMTSPIPNACETIQATSTPAMMPSAWGVTIAFNCAPTSGPSLGPAKFSVSPKRRSKVQLATLTVAPARSERSA
jgi:hypothetical protein